MTARALINRHYFYRGQLQPAPPVFVPHHHKNRVDFQRNPQDALCAAMGAIGMSSKCIAENTGLGFGQIAYRLKKGQVKRKEYRDGTSAFAKYMLNNAVTQISPMLDRHLQAAIRNPAAVAA